MKRLMQSIFSVRNECKYKIFYILGLKFKIKRNLDIKNIENKVNQLEIENNIQTFSYYNGDEFVKCLNLRESFIRKIDGHAFYKICNKYFSYKELKNYPPLEILMYIAACLDTNNIEKAYDLLMNFVKMHSTKEIWRIFPVAKFAKEQGITDENIEKSVFVFDKLEKSRNEKIFEKLLEGKTVAIVGNGPSELRKGKGAEIDAHDIVIRINNYTIDGFENDYGTKTDIWVKCSNSDILHEIRDKNIQLIVYEPDYARQPLIDGYLDVMFSDKINIDYFDFEDHVELRKNLNIFPSTGLVIINKIITKCNVKSIDCYGFSFLQEKYDGYATHYFNDRTKEVAIKRSSHHSFDKESVYIKNLLLKFSNNEIAKN
jgi:hypothetical protein